MVPQCSRFDAAACDARALSPSEKENSKVLKEGSVCEARFPFDQRWYEAAINFVPADKSYYEVVFAGYESDGPYKLKPADIRHSGTFCLRTPKVLLLGRPLPSRLDRTWGINMPVNVLCRVA